MAPELILQGLTGRTYAETLGEMLAGDVQRAILSVAFVSENGVALLEPHLAPHAARVTVFAGIRNEITSVQALRRLLALGVSLYAVDTGSRRLLFHPKLYHVRCKQSAELSVGSANLTLGGLNNNVEAGLRVGLDLADQEDAQFVADLEARFDGLEAGHPGNVIKIGQVAQIEALLDAGRVVDEDLLPPPRPATSAKAGSSDPTPRMKMVPAPVHPKAKPKGAAPAAKAGAGPAAAAAPAPAGVTVAPALELVWESRPLKRRSLGIPTNPNSNPTGSTILGSGTFGGIDRVTYFRNHLFGHLVWTLNGQIETAPQAFDLVIKGVLIGTVPMTLRHSLTRAAAAPNDNNSPTSISWDQARPLVARPDLLGRTMRIWRSTADSTKFRIEID